MLVVNKEQLMVSQSKLKTERRISRVLTVLSKVGLQITVESGSDKRHSNSLVSPSIINYVLFNPD